MSAHYGSIAFTDAVRDVQRSHGSHGFYDRKRVQGNAVPGIDSLTEDEKDFLVQGKVRRVLKKGSELFDSLSKA